MVCKSCKKSWKKDDYQFMLSLTMLSNNLDEFKVIYATREGVRNVKFEASNVGTL